MNNLLAKIKNDLGNLSCPNCKKSAIISINGGKVRMNIDCPKEQDDFCSFFDRLDDKLRKHTVNPTPKKEDIYKKEDNFLNTSSKFVEFQYSNPGLFLLRDKIMTSDQISFYNYFKAEINKGRRVEIYGNKGYVILLVNEYLELLNKETDCYFTRKSNNEVTERDGGKKNYGNFTASISSTVTTSAKEVVKIKSIHKNCTFSIKETINKLSILNNLYDFIDLSNYIGDVYCFGGKFQEALKCFDLNPKSLNVLLTNKILNIKTVLGLDISAIEMLCIRKDITKFGLDNFDKITDFSNELLKKDALKRKKGFLNYINIKYKNDRKGLYWQGERGFHWQLFYDDAAAGSDLRQKFIERYQIKTYGYDQIPEFIDYCNEVSRNAENLLRKEMNIPNVGEGWLSETELFYKIKSYLPTYEVIQHASPDWLGKQHLDIFIPRLYLAFEYHGKQHFEPVDFFGGQKGFENSQKRDKMKREKCKASSVMLIELKQGYDFKEVINVIETYKSIFRN